MAEIFDVSTNFIIHQGFAKLIAWHDNPGIDGGTSFGTAVTTMDGNTTAKLMPSQQRIIADNLVEMINDQIKGYGYLSQIFRLVPASGGGFRIVSYLSGKCLDYGDWFYNPDGSRTNVRHLVFKSVDPTSQSQIFTTEKQMTDPASPAGRFVCTVEGEKFQLTPNDWPAKDSVLLTLAKYTGVDGRDSFLVEPQSLNSIINIKIYNNMKFAVSFAVQWQDGRSPPVTIGYDESGTLSLNGFDPPRGTSCCIVAIGADLGKDRLSGDNFTVALPRNDPYVEYSLNEGFHMNFKSRFYG